MSEVREPDAPDVAFDEVAERAEEDALADQVVHDIEQVVRERDDLRELSQRLQADFENYRKRMMRDQENIVDRATDGLVEQLLPVLDNFAAALGHIDSGGNGGDADQLRKGFTLAAQELKVVLERNGLEVIDAAGVPFDPNEHEAVAQEPGEGEPVVGEVFRAGYRLKGRVLRPAMVKVTHEENGGA